MGLLIYMAHPLRVSHLRGVVAVVGLGGPGDHLLFLPALEHESPCASAGVTSLL
jgi:hypothetical protein